ncbi:MAG: response regulator [Bacteroidota bacterium]
MKHIRKIKILIADDHELVREGIISLLQSDKEIEIAGTASDGYQVLELAVKHEYDICLLDINMPELDGLETTKQLKQKKPSVKIIILTTYNDREIISEMVLAGVSGYMLKNATRKELTEAIKKVAGGGLFFSNEVHSTIMENYVSLSRTKKDENPVELTKRENEILQLLIKEFTNEKIASTLKISYRTVETHRKNILQKTGSHSLAGLIKFAYSNGFVK